MNNLNYTLKVITSRFPRDDQAMKKNLNTGTADFWLPNLQDAELSSESGILQLWRTDTVKKSLLFKKKKNKKQNSNIILKVSKQSKGMARRKIFVLLFPPTGATQAAGEKLETNRWFSFSGWSPISVSDKIIALIMCYHGYHEDTAIH